jgi:hypothetical protein
MNQQLTVIALLLFGGFDVDCVRYAILRFAGCASEGVCQR